MRLNLNYRFQQNRQIFIVVSIIAIIYLIPFFVFQTGWFGDDLIAIRYAKQCSGKSLISVLLYENESMRRYNPLTQIIIVKNFELFKLNPIAIRFLNYILFLTAICMACLLSKRLKMPNNSISLGTILFSLHQIIIMPLFRNGRPEPFILALGLVALYTFDLATTGFKNEKTGIIKKKILILSSATVLFLCISSSVLGFCFLFILPVWSTMRRMLTQTRCPKFPDILKYLISVMVIPFLVGVAYLSLYLFVGASLGEEGGRYEVGIGFHILKNIVISIFGVVNSVSTPILACAYYQKNLLLLIGCGLMFSFLSISFVIFVYIIWVSKLESSMYKKYTLGVLAIWMVSAVLCFFPFVITKHVSEIYLYHATLFFSFGIGYLLHLAKTKKKKIRNSVMLVTIMLFLSHCISSVQKFTLIKYNADRFKSICQQIDSKRFPVNKKIYLFESNPPEYVYSQFIMTLKELYYFGPQVDYEVKWIDKNEANEISRLGEIVWEVSVYGELKRYI